ncbi:MAG: TonB-dependent receptor [Myxococcales bacterium]|jgi:iron complex outermembrane receptor protein|nr:TonB-dependent receptor [Myxococcales bacterium]
MARRLSSAHLSACLFTAICLLTSAPVGAAQGDIALDEVLALGEATPWSVADRKAASTPTQAQLKEPTGFVSAVERQSGEHATPADLAARSAGVTVRDQGHNQPASISLRGSSSEQVTVVLDGMPLNGLAGGGFDLTALPAPFVRRLSVARGALGARYGSGALGGAVDIELLAPARGERRFFGELGHGSFLTFDASLGGALGFDITSVLVSAYARTSRGDYPFLYDPTPLVADDALIERRRENNASQRYGALARVHRDGAVKLDLLLEADGGLRGVPGAVQAPTRTAEQRDARALLLGKASGAAFGTEFEGRLGARLGFLEWSSDRHAPEPWQHEYHVFAELNAKRFFGVHALELSARLGHEGLTGPSHGTHDRPLAALFAGGELELGPFALLPAVRAEFVGERFGLSPKLGISLAITDDIELRANAGRSFRAPSFGELYLEQGSVSPNPDLTSETAIFGDAGIEARLSPTTTMPLSLRGAASGFVTRHDDVILYELHAPMRIKPYNLGRALVWGGEFEAEAALALKRASLRLRAAYTLSFSENQSGDSRYDGRDLPFHPRHRLTSRLDVEVWRLSAHLGAELQSRQQVNRSNTDALDGRARIDAGVSARLHRPSGLRLTAELGNLFGAQGQDLYGYPLAGRTFHITLGFDADLTPAKDSP